MSQSAKVQHERKRQGLCVECGKKPKAGLLRCEPCLQRQRDYDRAWRAKQKGATVEPQCKLEGRMRAEHVFDEDGLCDCGQRKMEFAPRPPLRPEVLRAVAPRRASTPVRPKPVLPVTPPAAPLPAVDKMIGGLTFAALIADLERKREQIDRCLASVRAINEWWPRT